MKKLNKIIILFVLLSFVACGTAPVASSDSEKKPEESSQDAVQNESGESQAEAADGKASEDGSEKSVKKAETDAETGDEDEVGGDVNYEGNHYNGPATSDFSEGVNKYATGGCSAAMGSWQAAFDKDPKNSRIAFNIAVCYERAKDSGSAASWYEKSYIR